MLDSIPNLEMYDSTRHEDASQDHNFTGYSRCDVSSLPMELQRWRKEIGGQ
jgi:hypothetical protein